MRIRFFALAALALSLAACTQDEAGFLPEGAEGTPIVFREIIMAWEHFSCL